MTGSMTDAIAEGEMCDYCWVGSLRYIGGHRMECDTCQKITSYCDRY